MEKDQKIDVYLVCNARYHDTNFARLELLKLLAENEDIHTRVAENFSDVDAISSSKLLITYTCDLRPSLEEQVALGKFLEGGGRWFALHATNALLEFVGGKADTPDLLPKFMELLGSRFIAHPANQKIEIKVTDVDHPLTRNIDDFEVQDEEPYYCEALGEQLVLLEAFYHEPSVGYVRSDYGIDKEGGHPQMYLHPCGDGEVLYLSLGHCTGKHDMKPLADIVPVVRGSWDSPVYYELLRRGIRWGTGGL